MATSRRDSRDQSKDESSLGGCEECFIETLSRIQSERVLIAREITQNIKTLKEQEQASRKIIKKGTK